MHQATNHVTEIFSRENVAAGNGRKARLEYVQTTDG